MTTSTTQPPGTGTPTETGFDHPLTEDLPCTTWATPTTVPVPRDTLRMQIDIYEDSIILRAHANNAVYTRMISADEAAALFTQHTGLNTGLLPEGALWTATSELGRITAIWQPPAIWPVALQEQPFEPPTRLNLPMPGLIFICPQGQSPWIFAAKRKPSDINDQLFHAPVFNVFRNGRICPGNHKFPEDPSLIPTSFFQSFFSPTADTQHRSNQHPTNLRQLWKDLDGKQNYPLRDLLPCTTVAEAIQLPTHAA